MPKDSSAQYYRDNKERLQKKKLMKDIKVILKKKKSAIRLLMIQKSVRR